MNSETSGWSKSLGSALGSKRMPSTSKQTTATKKPRRRPKGSSKEVILTDFRTIFFHFQPVFLHF